MNVKYPAQKTLFAEQLVNCNGLRQAGFEQWAFYAGMLFGAKEKWWGDRGLRPRPHEGIDLCLYTDKAGRPFRLVESSRIPVMLDGEIAKIEEDLLGDSVYVGHPIDDGRGRRLWTVYGHTNPAEHIAPGRRVQQGEIIATLTMVDGRTSTLFAHLHLSMAWVSTAIALHEINWETLHDPGISVLLDPLHAMRCPYRILDPEASVGPPSQTIS